jgi:dUTP pyrophosphatase
MAFGFRLAGPTYGAAMLPVRVATLPHFQGLELPAYATHGSAGLDLQAAVEAPVVVPSLGRALIPTGLAIAVPEGFEAQVRPRSGLALKQGLIVPNAPGTIDSDYRGEVKVIIANISAEPVTIERGMRIAQLIVARYERIEWQRVEALDETARGAGGFGSTGTAARSQSDRGR